MLSCRIQEIVGEEGHEEGRLPRNVECELTEDLVDACVPGDIVTICGIVNFINTNVDVGGSGKSLVDLETIDTCCIQRNSCW